MTTSTPTETTDVSTICNALADQALKAGRSLCTVPGRVRDEALRKIAEQLLASAYQLKQANALDLEAGIANGLSSAMLDRLKIDDKRIASMADAVRQVADQTDPVGKIQEGRVLPNGLQLQKVRVPIGVVLIIFESRPNVTSDAAALCLKSGNAVILRGGKEAVHSNKAIAECVQAGLKEVGIDEHAVQLVPTTDRAAVGELLKMQGRIDICIPRGGASLIRAVVEQSHIPVIKHYAGNCHVYVDANCDDQMAVDICINAKTQRTGVCNAAETILIHKDAADRGLLKSIGQALIDEGVEVRGCEVTCKLLHTAKPATEEDWHEEYLDMIVAIRVVDSLDQAIDHINTYGSQHTDAIITNRVDAADSFVKRVDTANAFVNCSTRFSDGGEYGLGAEIGISTDKLHARGPMGADDLTTYKWIAYGNGQTRH